VVPGGLLVLFGVMLGTWFAGCNQENPRVQITTDLGDIVIEIFETRAPVTAANFLQYVRERRFEGATFYRTVTPDNQPANQTKIEVIQGGLKDDPGQLALPPIPHETTEVTGLRHLDGTVSMARAGPGTASSEFFICIGDQPELDFGGDRNPDGQGFAAFGRVVEGMGVVLEIQRQPADGQWLMPETPIRDVLMLGPQESQNHVPS
jgi:peptidyl-prolyl cis-trans isomerase A (cyclophilin A)